MTTSQAIAPAGRHRSGGGGCPPPLALPPLLLLLLLTTAYAVILAGHDVRRGRLRHQRSGDNGETDAVDHFSSPRHQQPQSWEPLHRWQPVRSASTRPRIKWRQPRRDDSRATRGFEMTPSPLERGNGGSGDENTTESGGGGDGVLVVVNPLDTAHDGGWSEWSDWQLAGSCSTTCDEGDIAVLRNRSCTLEYLGCNGDDVQNEIRECNNFPCLMYGTWGDWSPWTTAGCSVTCSIGVKVMIRWRECDPSTATELSLGCLGPSTSTYTQSCKVAVPCGVGQPDALASNTTSDSPEPGTSRPLYAVIIATLVGVPLAIALACSVGALAHAVCLPEARRRRQERLLAATSGSGSVSSGASPAVAVALLRDVAPARRTACRCATTSLVAARPPPPCCAAAADRLSRPPRPSWDML